jgi:hypothetical protein
MAASASISEPADVLSAELSSAVMSGGSSPIAPLASGADGGEGNISGDISGNISGDISGNISDGGEGSSSSTAELPVSLLRAAVGLAKVALARNECALCIRRLEGLPATEPAVLQMRGEAHAALGELEKARAELTQAASLWWRANDGLHEQATLVELERVRRRLDAQHVDAGRLIVFHAAPLVEHVEVAPTDAARCADGAEAVEDAAEGGNRGQGATSTTKLHPIAFSKRLGLRAWRQLRSSLTELKREIKVSLETATVENLVGALQQSGRPILHFLPTRDYEHGVTMESYDGELKPLPLAQLHELVERAAPRRPSLVFLCARQSTEAGRVFLQAGVPAVVCLRAFLPEADVAAFVGAFYAALLGGKESTTPAAAFAAAKATLGSRFRVGSMDGFALLTKETTEGAVGSESAEEASSASSASLIKAPPPGELRDFSPKLCPSNLPFSSAMDSYEPTGWDEGEMSRPTETPSRVYTSGGAAWSVLPDTALPDPADERTELLAHGSAFVGRHLEMHALIRSCLHNQLTAVYGPKGAGKSALVLEAARYLRQRNRFPHGIFCCSLEGLRNMKAVRTRLGSTLNIPARSVQELCDMMARYRSCLLILDRCEDAIRKKMPQFEWLLTQLLQSSVKVLISSQTPLDASHEAVSRSMRAISLPRMNTRDAALLLLETCERNLTAEEVGATDDETILSTLRKHPLIRKIGGMPAAVRWAARRLADVDVAELNHELNDLSPSELAALTSDGHGTLELSGALSGLAPERAPSTGALSGTRVRRRPTSCGFVSAAGSASSVGALGGVAGFASGASLSASMPAVLPSSCSEALYGSGRGGSLGDSGGRGDSLGNSSGGLFCPGGPGGGASDGGRSHTLSSSLSADPEAHSRLPKGSMHAPPASPLTGPHSYQHAQPRSQALPLGGPVCQPMHPYGPASYSSSSAAAASTLGASSPHLHTHNGLAGRSLAEGASGHAADARRADSLPHSHSYSFASVVRTPKVSSWDARHDVLPEVSSWDARHDAPPEVSSWDARHDAPTYTQFPRTASAPSELSLAYGGPSERHSSAHGPSELLGSSEHVRASMRDMRAALFAAAADGGGMPGVMQEMRALAAQLNHLAGGAAADGSGGGNSRGGPGITRANSQRRASGGGGRELRADRRTRSWDSRLDSRQALEAALLDGHNDGSY